MSINIWRRFGEAVDHRYLKKVGAISVPGTTCHLLLICFHPYHGKELVQTTGQVIKSGEPICEIHLSNKRITQIAAEPGDRSMEWHLIGMLKKEFSLLAEAIKNNTIPDVKGIYGVNVMPAGARRLGFTLVPVPKGWNRIWLAFWESMLRMIFYSYKTNKKATLQRTSDPYEIWMSKEEFLRRYAK